MGIIMKNLASLFLLLFYATGSVNAQELESSNLPILMIDTDGWPITDEPKVSAHLGMIYNGPGQRNLRSDPFNEYNGLIGIEIRGSSSQSFDKKSFAFETRDSAGENRNVSLLGMPKENDWVLHGPYSDKSLMRNALAYQIGESVMAYAPRTRFVEVLLNGKYWGVYLLTEKIKRDKNRVGISKLESSTSSGEELTGGYILKIDKNTGSAFDGFASPYPPIPESFQEIFYQYHYPKPDDINPAQENYIRAHLLEVEAVLASRNYADSVDGYWKYLDVTTFIDFLLLNELCKNIDGYRLSTFLYKDRDSIDGRLKMGPLWDFNLAFGNYDYCGTGVPEGWVKDFNEICSRDFWAIPFWWEKLWKDKKFRVALRDRWEVLREDQLSDARLMGRIDSLAVLLGEAQERNFERWEVLGEYVWPNWFVGNSHAEEVDYLKGWLEDRIAWMEEEMLTVTKEIYDEDDFFTTRAFPNPFHDQLTFEFYLRETESYHLRLFNAQGKLISEHFSNEYLNGLNTLQFNAAALAPGIYFFQARIDEAEAWTTGKLIKAY